jgi:hypothetical protein
MHRQTPLLHRPSGAGDPSSLATRHRPSRPELGVFGLAYPIRGIRGSYRGRKRFEVIKSCQWLTCYDAASQGDDNAGL